jgi:Leucine-rich repeat (LRR) protein
MIRIKQNTLLSLLFLLCVSLQAQTIKGYTNDQVTELSSKVEDQVRFLEYLLNTIGDAQTSARDKDVIIRESYLKIFRDAKVQVEDDLLLDRKVVTNKDVTAYLKDIEFFYKTVEFKFKIREVKPGQKENGEVYFLASLDRTITAVGIGGEKISNTKPRFVEINLDEKTQELKIVSVYTTKVSRDEELKAWWTSLDAGWKSYFKNRFQLNATDSVELDHWYKFVSIDSLNLAGNRQIKNLNALSELRDLKHLDISNTAITNLAPISNVTLLESLAIANTSTSNIQFIKYSDRLKYLDISNTKIENISELLNLKNLIGVKAERTPIQSFSVLNEFKNLKDLDLTESGFNNLENIKDLVKLERLDLGKNYMLNFSAIASLTSLRYLDVSNTNMQDLTPIKSMSQLEFLDVTGTSVADLGPIENLPLLKKISADQTKLSVDAATDFVRRNREILLIHHVKDLESWWEGLPAAWKAVLKKANPSIRNDQPGVEILTQTVTLPSLNLDEAGIETLNPLIRFVNLSDLSFSGNPLVVDLIPLSEINTLRKVVGKNSGTRDLSILKEVELLEYIDLEGSPVESISSLVSLPKLLYLNVNRSSISHEEVPGFLIQRPEINVIYRSEELQSWWTEMESTWKELFRKQYSLPESPSTEQLHQLTGRSELSFERIGVQDLNPLTVFANLRKLSIFDAPISSIAPVSSMTKLTSLRLSQIPSVDFLSVSGLIDLVELDLSNTGIEDLLSISNLKNLQKLNLSGTNLKSLKGLENLGQLEELDVASTNLRTLKPLEGLNSLKKLSCFNTNLTTRAVDSFKAAHPACEVRFY